MTTPARRQYLDIKSQHPDALLMYQVGDFFEFFDEDARIAARVLQIVLTSRGYGPGERVPLAGVPAHAWENYAGRLVAERYTVAICEQVEVAGRGLVKRAVTRILSSGTVVEPAMVPRARDNYLVAVAWSMSAKAPHAGLAYVEASTGAFACTQWDEADALEKLGAELHRLSPAEVLVATVRDHSTSVEQVLAAGPAGFRTTACPDLYFDAEHAHRSLCRHFQTTTLAGYGCEQLSLATSCAGALLAYLHSVNPTLERLITALTTYHADGFVQIDGRTWAALEVVEPSRGGAQGSTLLGVLDATRTAMGTRLLRRTLLHPLTNRSLVEDRLNAVTALHADAELRQVVGALLDGIPDLERLIGRVLQGMARPRDTQALAASLARVTPIREALQELTVGPLVGLRECLDPCSDATALIEQALVPFDEEGRVIRRGHSAALDALEDSVSSSRQWLARLETAERERTGIKSLRVTYNKVFGYGIEVTRPNLGRVPPEYERRQTLATGERYSTPALKEHEARVQIAGEQIAALERELYTELLRTVATYHAQLRATAAALAQLDVWLGLAEVATVRGYVRPELTDDPVLEIEAGRHPLVEAALEGREFAPNDTHLRAGDDRTSSEAVGHVLMLTGPNMAGKSTYLRQVALIVLMAQSGSFVPAARARIGIVDRLFTRIGADDDLTHGISTFMREMTETAYILRHATHRSLVVLDEIGRGTGTEDGHAIARAVLEYLHDRVRARTLFATHFQALTSLADDRPGVRLAAMDVLEEDGDITFLHRLVPGRIARSYGVHVALMAGLPQAVTARATTLLAAAPATHHAARQHLIATRGDQLDGAQRAWATVAEVHASEFPYASNATPLAPALRELAIGLANLRIATMTPIDAMNVLNALQQQAAAALRDGDW